MIFQNRLHFGLLVGRELECVCKVRQEVLYAALPFTLTPNGRRPSLRPKHITHYPKTTALLHISLP
jgi:hypothetical protein